MALSPLQNVSSAALYSAASAMNAFGEGMNAVAHNLANVSTAAFAPQRVDYMSGPADQGVQVGAITTPGSFLTDAQAPLGSVNSALASADMLPPEVLNPSNTDIPREFTSMIATQRAYEANAVSIRTGDSLLGTVVDLKA